MGSAQLCDDPLAVQAGSQQPPDGVNIDVNVVWSQKCGANPSHAREQEFFRMLNVCETNISSDEVKQSNLAFWKPVMFLQLRKVSWGQ